MTIKEYVKTAPIHAIQWTGMQGTTIAIINWAASFGVEIQAEWDFSMGDEFDGVRCLWIPTLEGPMKASVGDFIAKGVKNEFWAIKPDVMEMTYKEV